MSFGGFKDIFTKNIWENKERKLRILKAQNEDAISGLKDQITDFEKTALLKKVEFEKASPNIKQIIKREIEGVFQSIDKTEERLTMIFDNLTKIEDLLETLEKIRVGEFSVTEKDIDSVIGNLERVLDKIMEADIAHKDLADITYEPSKVEVSNIPEPRVQEEQTLSERSKEPVELDVNLLKRFEGLE